MQKAAKIESDFCYCNLLLMLKDYEILTRGYLRDVFKEVNIRAQYLTELLSGFFDTMKLYHNYSVTQISLMVSSETGQGGCSS